MNKLTNKAHYTSILPLSFKMKKKKDLILNMAVKS